jgi:hypothetical protein
MVARAGAGRAQRFLRFGSLDNESADRRAGSVLATAAALLIGVACTLVLLAGRASADPTISKLRHGSATGVEDYLYTSGNVIFPEAHVDSNTYYRFVVRDSSGAQRGSVPCTSSDRFSSTNNTFTLQGDVPVSTGTAWSYTLDEFKNSSCTGTPVKSDRAYFDVARATSFADSGATGRSRGCFPLVAPAAPTRAAATGRTPPPAGCCRPPRAGSSSTAPT